MIGAALAVLSMAGKVAGMIGSAKANKKAEQMLQQRRQELDLEYKADYNQDFLNTPMAKSAINLLSQKYIENTRKLAQGSVISGASNEKALAGAEELQKPYVNTISQLAGYGQQRQDSIRQGYLSRLGHVQDLQYGQQLNKAATWASLYSNAATGGQSAAQADGAGAFGGGGDWFKGIFKGGQTGMSTGSGETSIANGVLNYN